MENNEVGNITSLNELYALMLKREDRIYDAINGLNKKIDEVKEELKQTKEELEKTKVELREEIKQTEENINDDVVHRKEFIRLKNDVETLKKIVLSQWYSARKDNMEDDCEGE